MPGADWIFSCLVYWLDLARPVLVFIVCVHFVNLSKIYFGPELISDSMNNIWIQNFYI